MSLSGDVIDCSYQRAGSTKAPHQMELSGCPDKRRCRVGVCERFRRVGMCCDSVRRLWGT